MMAIRQYSKEDLLHLKQSPLVQKPDNLPAIEQWIDESQQAQSNANTRRQQTQSTRGAGGDGSPMGNFSTGARPSLMPRTNVSKSGDDISLGPPKTVFASSRNTTKLSDFGDKSANSTSDGAQGDEQDVPRSRFFSDRPNRKSMNDKEGKDHRESWTSRRGLGGDDETKQEGRHNRRDRDHDGERRNGFGDKHEGRWGERRQNGDRQGGWRDRERDRRDRDGDRSGPAEKEPEWMEDSLPQGGEDDLRTMGMPRNQEQFQKWKEAMSGKKPAQEGNTTAESPSATAEPVPSKQPTVPLKLEGIVDKPFGAWGGDKSTASTLDTAAVSTKAVPTKTKGSRFASMFKESQTKDESLPETSIQKNANEIANGAAEDEAGFKRILQMLGGTDINTSANPFEGPSSPPPKTSTNGTKQKSRFTGFFDQAAKSPERVQSPPDDSFAASRGMGDDLGPFNSASQQFNQNDQLTRANTVGSAVPTESIASPLNGNRDQAASHRMKELGLDQQQPPSRGAATPDLNIQNLLSSQRAQRPQGQDKNSEFLLGLLQNKTSRPSSQQARPDNFPLWLDQPPNMPEPHAPKPRAPPPPGLFEDQLLRNTPQEAPRQDQQPMTASDMPPQRRTSYQQMPQAAFYEMENRYLQQMPQEERRNFSEPPHQQAPPPQQQPGGLGGPRRMSGHPNMPPMPPMGMPNYASPPQMLPPDSFMQSGLSGHGPPQQQPRAPPPGFNPHMPRHPPGFQNIPNIFQAPQQQPQQRGGPPPQDMTSPFPGAPAAPGGMSSPPNAPPGFFPGPPPGQAGLQHPPGFGGIMGGLGGQQMRSPTDPMQSAGPPGGVMQSRFNFDSTGGVGGLGGTGGPRR